MIPCRKENVKGIHYWRRKITARMSLSRQLIIERLRGKGAQPTLFPVSFSARGRRAQAACAPPALSILLSERVCEAGAQAAWALLHLTPLSIQWESSMGHNRRVAKGRTIIMLSERIGVWGMNSFQYDMNSGDKILCMKMIQTCLACLRFSYNQNIMIQMKKSIYGFFS